MGKKKVAVEQAVVSLPWASHSPAGLQVAAMADDGHMDSVKVTLMQSVFAEAHPYFVAVQLGGSTKRRTEVAPASARPAFRKAEFTMALSEGLFAGTQAVLYLGAFMVLKHVRGTEGKARLLGTGSLRLSSCAARLLAGQSVTADVVLREDGKVGPAAPPSWLGQARRADVPRAAVRLYWHCN